MPYKIVINSFTFGAPPTISSLTPNSNTLAPLVPTSVAVAGTGFDGTETWSLNGGAYSGACAFTSSIAVTATLPTGPAPGIYTLTILNNHGVSNGLSFEYVDA